MATSVPGVPAKLGKSRAVPWTLNNYTDAEVALLRDAAKSARYMVFGYEICPNTGTPHLQGFVAWETPRSLDKFKKDISQRLHFALPMRGTHKQASEYCKKPESKDPDKNPSYEEFGELPAQGQRTDWCVAVEQIVSGTPVEEVVVAQPQLLPGIRALERFKAMMLKPKHRDVEVIVCYGDAGTGKSRYAWDNFPDLYSKPNGEWWDGYSGQTTILLDDYYGGIQYSEFLKVLDRYPLQVPVKGGFVYGQWDRVIITSNKHPSLWYSRGMTPALARRLHKIFYYSINAPPSLCPSPSCTCSQSEACHCQEGST